MVDASYPPQVDPQPVPPPTVPEGAGVAPQAQPGPQYDFSQGDALRKAAGDPLAQADAMSAQRRAVLNPLMNDVQQAGARQQQHSQARQQQLASNPQSPEPQQGMGIQAAANWVMIATGIGALAGAMTRRSATNAMAAFTGALEGVQQGNKQAFEQNKTIWEQENKRINQQLEQQRDAYLDIMNSDKMDLNMKMLMLQQKAAELHDDQTMQLAARKDMQLWAERADKLEIARQQGVIEYKKIDAQLARYGGAGRTGAAGISDEAAQRIAEQLDAGMPPPRNLTRPDMEKIQNLRGAKSPEELKNNQFDYTRGQSQARTGGTMEQRSSAATEEMKAAIPLALEASRNLPRGQYVPINKLIQLGQEATSNPQYNDFLIKTQTLAKAYGRAMNPQGIPRVSEAAEAKAEGILSKAISQEAYEVQARALWQEAENVQAAIRRTRPGAEPLQSPFGAGAQGGGGGPKPGTVEDGYRFKGGNPADQSSWEKVQ